MLLRMQLRQEGITVKFDQLEQSLGAPLAQGVHVNAALWVWLKLSSELLSYRLPAISLACGAKERLYVVQGEPGAGCSPLAPHGLVSLLGTSG